jgi:hypothetical protein
MKLDAQFLMENGGELARAYYQRNRGEVRMEPGSCSAGFSIPGMQYPNSRQKRACACQPRGEDGRQSADEHEHGCLQPKLLHCLP